MRSSRHVWPDRDAPRGTAGGGPRRVAGHRSERYEQHWQANRRRAVARVRRYVKTNGLQYLWHLTFAENVEEVPTADKAFWAFSRWLSTRSIPWIAVREFQKRGAVHYHLAVDRFLPHSEVAAAWGHGFVFVSGPKHGWRVDRAASYLTKYIAKDIEDRRLQGYHSYLRSANLRRWDTEDTFTRSPEEFVAYMVAVGELLGWETHYCRLGDEYQVLGAGPGPEPLAPRLAATQPPRGASQGRRR